MRSPTDRGPVWDGEFYPSEPHDLEAGALGRRREPGNTAGESPKSGHGATTPTGRWGRLRWTRPCSGPEKRTQRRAQWSNPGARARPARGRAHPAPQPVRPLRPTGKAPNGPVRPVQCPDWAKVPQNRAAPTARAAGAGARLGLRGERSWAKGWDRGCDTGCDGEPFGRRQSITHGKWGWSGAVSPTIHSAWR